MAKKKLKSIEQIETVLISLFGIERINQLKVGFSKYDPKRQNEIIKELSYSYISNSEDFRQLKKTMKYYETYGPKRFYDEKKLLLSKKTKDIEDYILRILQD